MVEVEGSGFGGSAVVVAKVLEKDECSPLMWKWVFVVTVVPRHSQVSAVVPEVEAMYSLVVVVESLEWTVASLVVVWAGVELVEPKVVDVGPDSALGPKNSWGADHVLKGAGTMMVGTESGQVLAAMDSKRLEAALEVELELLGSKVAELGLEFVMEAMH